MINTVVILYHLLCFRYLVCVFIYTKIDHWNPVKLFSCEGNDIITVEVRNSSKDKVVPQFLFHQRFIPITENKQLRLSRPGIRSWVIYVQFTYLIILNLVNTYNTQKTDFVLRDKNFQLKITKRGLIPKETENKLYFELPIFSVILYIQVCNCNIVFSVYYP